MEHYQNKVNHRVFVCDMRVKKQSELNNTQFKIHSEMFTVRKTGLLSGYGYLQHELNG